MRIHDGSPSGIGGSTAGRSLSLVLAGTLAVLLSVLLILLIQRGMRSLVSPADEEGAASETGAPEAPEPAESADSSLKVGGAPDPASKSGPERTVEPEPAPAEPEEVEGCAATGTVRIVGTDEPAPGVLVVYRIDTPGSGQGEIQERMKAPEIREADYHSEANADGAYRVEGLPEGDYRVFALRGETDFVSIAPADGRRIRVTEELSPPVVDIEVARGGVFYGTVWGPDGEPLAEAKVSAPPAELFGDLFDPDSGFSGVAETQTGEDGSYRIAGLPLEKAYYVIASADGLARDGTGKVSFTEDEREIEVDFTLTEGSVLSGLVLSSDGRPVEGVEVRLITRNVTHPVFMNEEGLQGHATDEAGTFRFESLPRGKYEVTAIPGGGKSVSREVECDGVDDVNNVVLQLETPSGSAGGLRVTGRVFDDLGVPLEGISIQLNGFAPTRGPYEASTSSKLEGYFEFENVPQGLFSLGIQDSRYAPYSKAGVTPGGEPLDLLLERLAGIRGFVVSKATGDPVGGALVRAVPVENDGAMLARIMAGQLGAQGPSTETSADGAFFLENIAPGRLRLRAEAASFGPGFSKELDVAPGSEVTDVTVMLSEGAVLRGVVVGPDSLPVRDASVRAIELSGGEWTTRLMKMMPTLITGGMVYSAKTDAEGAFELVHVPEASLSILASHPDFAPSLDQEVTVRADEVRGGVTLRLRMPAQVRVAARQKTEPLTGLMVQLLGMGPMKMGTTDAEGRFTFRSVAPGDYIIQLMDMAKMLSGQGLGMRQRSVTVAEGETLDVEFVFGTGAAVYGKVDGHVPGPMGMVVIRKPGGPAPEDQDPKDFSASLRAATYNVGMAFISPDKTYSIPDVPDGEYIIEIPVIPTDMTQAAEMPREARLPVYRETIEVQGGRDLEQDIRIRPRERKDEG